MIWKSWSLILEWADRTGKTRIYNERLKNLKQYGLFIIGGLGVERGILHVLETVYLVIDECCRSENL